MVIFFSDSKNDISGYRADRTQCNEKILRVYRSQNGGLWPKLFRHSVRMLVLQVADSFAE